VFRGCLPYYYFLESSYVDTLVRQVVPCSCAKQEGTCANEILQSVLVGEQPMACPPTSNPHGYSHNFYGLSITGRQNGNPFIPAPNKERCFHSNPFQRMGLPIGCNAAQSPTLRDAYNVCFSTRQDRLDVYCAGLCTMSEYHAIKRPSMLCLYVVDALIAERVRARSSKIGPLLPCCKPDGSPTCTIRLSHESPNSRGLSCSTVRTTGLRFPFRIA